MIVKQELTGSVEVWQEWINRGISMVFEEEPRGSREES